MPTRTEAAIRLDITLEMAKRHGIPSQISVAALEALEQDPPAWLLQSRSNRVPKKPVWVTLQCAMCEVSETARPKKWWPAFTALLCDDHDLEDFTAPAQGVDREVSYGVGSRFLGIVDSVAD